MCFLCAEAAKTAKPQLTQTAQIGVNILENAHASSFMVVSELCSNGDLFDYIRNVQAPPLLEVVCTLGPSHNLCLTISKVGVMLDVAHGLEYLHLLKPTVIHRDCKSSNILITSDGTAKITDFGLAQVKHSQRLTVEKRVGTVNWQAPELWKTPPKYNHKVDVFSCGMVYWEILQWHRQVKQFPWEVSFSCVCLLLAAHMIQEMNEHAIYETVGVHEQRCGCFCFSSHQIYCCTDPPRKASENDGHPLWSVLFKTCGCKTPRNAPPCPRL